MLYHGIPQLYPIQLTRNCHGRSYTKGEKILRNRNEHMHVYEHMKKSWKTHQSQKQYPLIRKKYAAEQQRASWGSHQEKQISMMCFCIVRHLDNNNRLTCHLQRYRISRDIKVTRIKMETASTQTQKGKQSKKAREKLPFMFHLSMQILWNYIL